MSDNAVIPGIEWFDALSLQEGRFSMIKRAVIREVPLDVFVNGKIMATIACTGSHPDELAVGYLYSEGIIRERKDITNLTLSPEKNAARISCASIAPSLPEDADAVRSIASSGARSARPSAGLAPFQNGQPEAWKLTPEKITGLMDSMIRGAVLHDTTGGTHCAALADSSAIIASREDIGRHNAIDMLAGYVLLNGIACEDKIIVRTGRASSEIVSKIWKMGVRVVVSISVPTSSAIRLAAEAGMTLVGGVRGGRMIIYNDKGRIAT